MSIQKQVHPLSSFFCPVLFKCVKRFSRYSFFIWFMLFHFDIIRFEKKKFRMSLLQWFWIQFIAAPSSLSHTVEKCQSELITETEIVIATQKIRVPFYTHLSKSAVALCRRSSSDQSPISSFSEFWMWHFLETRSHQKIYVYGICNLHYNFR